jgi:hypothetical protein
VGTRTPSTRLSRREVINHELCTPTSCTSIGSNFFIMLAAQGKNSGPPSDTVELQSLTGQGGDALNYGRGQGNLVQKVEDSDDVCYAYY